MRNYLSARGTQPFRPLLHLVAFYPLLLVVPVTLLLLSWGVLLSDYDALHQMWNERPLGGILAGVVTSVILGEVLLAVFLLDRDRHARATADACTKADPEAARAALLPTVPWWGYWAAWGVLMLLVTVPPEVLMGKEFRAAIGTDAEKVTAARARVWFPLGVALTAAAFVVLRLKTSAFDHPRVFGKSLLGAFGGLYVFTCLIHLGTADAYLDWLPAGVCVLLLIGFVTGLFAVFTHLAGRTPYLYPGLIAFFVVPFVIPSCQTDYRLPNMEIAGIPGGKTYYDQRVRLVNYPSLRTPERAAEARLIDDEAALRNWHARMLKEYDGDPQPVVVVTVSGGASSSAIYCADVLMTLEEELPGFSNRVRVVSGASGGMLGAAYFVTQLRANGLIGTARATAEYRTYVEAVRAHDRAPSAATLAALTAADEPYRTLMKGVRETFFRGLEEDFLGPVMQRWVHRDLPMAAAGRATTNDRGHALEQAWHRHLGGALDVPFRDLRDAEEAGALPSLVFTPMMVEDGRQLIISNLNLDYMTETAREPDPANPAGPGSQMSYMGVEFFRLFPKADQFRLSTAVRMSASFPYLSPSAAIPTDPVRHVVDAGYYDNYGTTVATKWLSRHAGWLAGETPGKPPNPQRTPEVLLLRIRCFGYERGRLDIVTGAETKAYAERVGLPDDAPHDELVQTWATHPPVRPVRTDGGLFSLTSPLFGLFSSWRANMVYRADERLGGAYTLLAARPGNRVPLSSYPIECSVNPPMNWILTTDDRSRIHADVRDNLKAALVVENLRRSRSASPPEEIQHRLAGAKGELPSAAEVLKSGAGFKTAPASVKKSVEAQALVAEKFARYRYAKPAEAKKK